MFAYLKDQYPFYGIKAAERRTAAKSFVAQHGLPPFEDLEQITKLLWQSDERELQHTAMEWVEKHKKSWTEGIMELFEYMIVTKSWWDTVDMIASHLVGTYCKKFPGRIPDLNSHWMNSGNMWLQRTALLFQLKYKETTDTELLFANIRALAGHKDFFIRKAIGWSLRELAKTNPEIVMDFVNKTELSNLSRKEAIRNIIS